MYQQSVTMRAASPPFVLVLGPGLRLRLLQHLRDEVFDEVGEASSLDIDAERFPGRFDFDRVCSVLLYGATGVALNGTVEDPAEIDADHVKWFSLAVGPC